MKKIFAFAAVAAAVLFAGNTVNAQLGINLGFAPQTYTTKITIGGNEVKDDLNMTGFFVGVNYNINLTGDLNVSAGAQFRMNTSSDEEGSLKTSMNQMLIDVPVLFNYGLNLTDDIKISVFLGPTFSLGLSGSSKLTIANVEGDPVDWYDKDGINRSRFDIAGTAGLSVSFQGIRLFGGYNMGLLNLDSDDNTTIKGRNWFIGLGYAL